MVVVLCECVVILHSHICHSTKSKKMMKTAKFPTHLFCRLENLDGKLLRTCYLFAIDLDLEVELVADTLPILCTGDLLMRLLRDKSRIQWPQFFPELFSAMLQFKLYRGRSALVNVHEDQLVHFFA